MKTVLKMFVLLLVLGVLSSCQAYESKADYFNGAVLVEYHQTTQRGNDDYLTMTFNEKGDYSVKFSYTAGYERSRFNQGKATLPKDFNITVVDSPKSKVISQYVLPGFLTITITHGDETESHDFQ